MFLVLTFHFMPLVQVHAAAELRQRPENVNPAGEPKMLQERPEGERKDLLGEDKTASREAMMAENKDQREQRCITAQEKTDEQITQFGDLKGERELRFAEFSEKLTLVISKLKAEGVSVTKLEADMTAFDGLTNEWSSAVEVYLVKLAAAKALTPNCATTQAELGTALQETRTQMQAVRTAAQAIPAFITNSIKPDLQAARQELVASKTSSTEDQQPAHTE